MTTLRARWEKPDYTGVTAEVPLWHIPHPKKSLKPPAFPLLSFFRIHPAFWTVYSPVNERSDSGNLQDFLDSGFLRQSIARSARLERFLGLSTLMYPLHMSRFAI